MVFGLLGSLGLASLMPSTWRLSTSLVLQTTAIAVLVYILYKIIQFIQYIRWTTKVYGDVPGPKKRHWLYGSGKYFPKGNEARLKYLLDLAENYGQEGYYLLWRSFQPVIVICAPKTMGQILKTAEPKTSGLGGSYRMLKPWLGEGLITSSGNRWARNRRLLTPAFHFDILKPYLDVYNSSTDTLIDHLNRCAEEGSSFETFQEISKCTLHVILKCAFSYDKDVQRQGESDLYVKAVGDIGISVTDRVRRPWLFPDFMWSLSSRGRQFNKNCDYVHKVAEEVIEKRRHILEKGGEETLKDRKYLDFLDILLTARDENGKGLTPTEIRHEVDTFMFAGHDTTASAISWILYSLAEHPEYQRKCQEEIEEIFSGRDTGDIEWNDLHRMDYLTMCIKEGLRLHCPVPMIARETTREFTLGDRVFPKGTQLTVNIWALHHNKKVWDRDMEYIPERFSKENVVKMDHYQFTPFSAGPRDNDKADVTFHHYSFWRTTLHFEDLALLKNKFLENKIKLCGIHFKRFGNTSIQKKNFEVHNMAQMQLDIATIFSEDFSAVQRHHKCSDDLLWDQLTLFYAEAVQQLLFAVSRTMCYGCREVTCHRDGIIVSH